MQKKKFEHLDEDYFKSQSFQDSEASRKLSEWKENSMTTVYTP